VPHVKNYLNLTYTRRESLISIHYPHHFSKRQRNLHTDKASQLEDSQPDKEVIASKLKGNTLRVYWHLLNNAQNTVGPREVQRELGFSSPALADYHLNKLVTLGLVEKRTGEYQLVREVDVGLLKQFIRLGTFILPRYILYATLFTTLLLFYVTQLRTVNFYSLYALILGILATGILWYETIRALQQKP
jgi:DNA-binding MarR family transcriptional regulator